MKKPASTNTKEGKGIPRNVPRNMSGNDKEPRGLVRNNKECHGTSRNSKKYQGTLRNDKEALGRALLENKDVQSICTFYQFNPFFKRPKNYCFT